MNIIFCIHLYNNTIAKKKTLSFVVKFNSKYFSLAMGTFLKFI